MSEGDCVLTMKLHNIYLTTSGHSSKYKLPTGPCEPLVVRVIWLNPLLAVRAIPFMPLDPKLPLKFACDELRDRDVSALRLPFDTDTPSPSRPFAPGRGEPGVGVKDDADPFASCGARPGCDADWENGNGDE